MQRLLFSLFISVSLTFSSYGQKTAPELLKQAVICSEAGNFEAAIELCNQAIALNHQYELAFFQRAISHELSGHISKAIEDYTQTIKINANNIQSYLNRGILYQQQKKQLAALSDFNKARSIDTVYTLSFLSGQVIKSLF